MSILSFAKKMTQRGAPASSPPAGGEKARGADMPEKMKGAEPAVAPATILLDLIPIVTEKSVRLQEEGTVAFRVPHTVTKAEVERALRARFKVQVKAIRMVRGRGKHRRRGQTFGQTPQWKKVYVKVDDVAAITVSP